MARSRVYLIAACLISVLVIASWGAFDLMQVTRIWQGQWEPEPTMVEDLLRSMDLDPEALAVSGVQPEVVESFIGDIERYLMLNAADFEYARLDYKQVTDFLRQTEQTVRSRKADLALITDRKHARAASGDLQGIYERHLQALLSYAENGFTAAELERWRALRFCRSIGYDNLPIEFQVVPRTEAEWVELRDAFSHERINTKRGEPVDEAINRLLQQERVSDAVRQAKQDYGLLLEPIKVVWRRTTTDTRSQP